MVISGSSVLVRFATATGSTRRSAVNFSASHGRCASRAAVARVFVDFVLPLRTDALAVMRCSLSWSVPPRQGRGFMTAVRLPGGAPPQRHTSSLHQRTLISEGPDVTCATFLHVIGLRGRSRQDVSGRSPSRPTGVRGAHDTMTGDRGLAAWISPSQRFSCAARARRTGSVVEVADNALLATHV